MSAEDKPAATVTTLPLQKADPRLIAMLRDTLASVERGEVVGLAIVEQRVGYFTGTAFEAPNLVALLGGVSVLHDRILARFRS